MGEMTGVSACNPHKEEDEGYLAAESARDITANPYPRGTIRYEEWRRGWQIKRDETMQEGSEGYLAAEAQLSASANPHPRGTIRYEEWRCGWQTKCNQVQRAKRLAEKRPGPEQGAQRQKPQQNA